MPRATIDVLAVIEGRSMPEPNSGCRLWLGAVNSKGYAQVAYQGRRHYVHRLLWQKHRGTSPRTVMHRCDTPSCVELYHLRAGTPRKNTRDMMQKGRHRCGSLPGARNPSAKLTAADVRAIRAARFTLSNSAQARVYNVTSTQVANIIAHRSWKGPAWCDDCGLAPLPPSYCVHGVCRVGKELA